MNIGILWEYQIDYGDKLWSEVCEELELLTFSES